MRIGIPFKTDSVKGINNMLLRCILVGLLCGGLAALLFYMARGELIPYHDKVEMTGYYEKGTYGSAGLTITLTNGEKYTVSDILYGGTDSGFDRKAFDGNVHKGDVIQFTYFRDDKYKSPYIYELKSEGRTYLSFEDAVKAEQKNRSEMIAVAIAFSVLGVVTIIVSVIRCHFLKKTLLKKQREPIRENTDPKLIRATVSGVIKEIYVKPYQNVKKGDVVLTIVTMKMEIPCVSLCDGIIENIYVHVNDGIQKDMVLVTLQ